MTKLQESRKNILVLIFAVPLFTLCGKTDDKRISTTERTEKHFQFTASKSEESRTVNKD